jgi:hypothetical protein
VQSTQAPPATPHALADVPSTHLPAEQQPLLHIAPLQQGWPGAPQGWQLKPVQTRPLRQVFGLQHGPLAYPPQGVPHIPPRQAYPVRQSLVDVHGQWA